MRPVNATSSPLRGEKSRQNIPRADAALVAGRSRIFLGCLWAQARGSAFRVSSRLSDATCLSPFLCLYSHAISGNYAANKKPVASVFSKALTYHSQAQDDYYALRTT